MRSEKKKLLLPFASLFHCGGQAKESHNRPCRIMDVFAFASNEHVS